MILYEDASWLAVAKPAGMPTHGPRVGVLGAVEWLKLHLALETHPISRLDAGTSGVLLLARNPAAAARAEEIHATGAAVKTYVFLADSGHDLPDKFARDDALDGKPAHTAFRRLGAGEVAGRNVTRWEAEITRGRRHQIRRHAAAAGLPLLGDDEHGGSPWPRLALHCREVRWPEVAEPMACPVPGSFAAATSDDLAWAVAEERRGDWPAQVSDARRAIHRDEIPGLPAAIDVYGPWFNAVWFDETTGADEAHTRLAPWLDRVAAAAGCRGGVIRAHARDPHRKGLVSDLRTVGDPPPSVFPVVEHGLRYRVDLLHTQHTGLFLDQRDTRRRLFQAAVGARMANLFAFTCSFSVVAAAAGCEVVFSVDSAKACLETGKGNFATNGLDETGRGKFVQEDARKWLARQLRRQDKRPDEFTPLNLLVCDPPVFAGGKGGARFGLQQEWPHLAEASAHLLGPAGQALFANNHRGGDHRRYRAQLAAKFARVEDLRPPLDFPLLPDAEFHVRMFWCHR
ncbi:MAG: hypothetical protein GY838_09310 [bacterium]|nr:hypothetical protein [bacterium]